MPRAALLFAGGATFFFWAPNGNVCVAVAVAVAGVVSAATH